MRKLVIASVIGLIFLIAEIVGGAISNSLAIISDVKIRYFFYMKIEYLCYNILIIIFFFINIII